MDALLPGKCVFTKQDCMVVCLATLGYLPEWNEIRLLFKDSHTVDLDTLQKFIGNMLTQIGIEDRIFEVFKNLTSNFQITEDEFIEIFHKAPTKLSFQACLDSFRELNDLNNGEGLDYNFFMKVCRTLAISI